MQENQLAHQELACVYHKILAENKFIPSPQEDELIDQLTLLLKAIFFMPYSADIKHKNTLHLIPKNFELVRQRVDVAAREQVFLDSKLEEETQIAGTWNVCILKSRHKTTVRRKGYLTLADYTEVKICSALTNELLSIKNHDSQSPLQIERRNDGIVVALPTKHRGFNLLGSIFQYQNEGLDSFNIARA